MMNKWIFAAAAVLILAAGCSNKETDKSEDKQDNRTEVEQVVNEGKDLPYQFPLTGAGTEQKPDGRAVAVVVNNHPLARPQSGLNQADLVYEVLAEGEVTRFIAIFQSEQPEKIGPVRSAREYFIELASGYESFFIAHGYSPEAKEMLERGDIDNINGMQFDGSLFKRASFRKAPHNSYISYENILKGAEKKGFEMDQVPEEALFLNAEESEQLEGAVVEDIMVSYGTPSYDSIYEFDAETRKYHRFTEGTEMMDHDSKLPMLIDNVLVVQMDHQVVDSSGRREIDMASGGKGYLFQQGKVNEIEWKNEAGRIIPYKGGVKAGFVPGKTWINIVPSIGDVSLEAAP